MERFQTAFPCHHVQLLSNDGLGFVPPNHPPQQLLFILMFVVGGFTKQVSTDRSGFLQSFVSFFFFALVRVRVMV